MKNKNYLIYIVVFLIVVCIGIGGYFLLKPKEKEPSDNPVSENKELAIANEVKVNKSSLSLNKGGTETFTITVKESAGVINVTSSDTNVITISNSNDDCNGSVCFYDAPNGSDATIEYTVTAIGEGNATIKVNLEDLLTYDEKQINGSGVLTVTVK